VKFLKRENEVHKRIQEEKEWVQHFVESKTAEHKREEEELNTEDGLCKCDSDRSQSGTSQVRQKVSATTNQLSAGGQYKQSKVEKTQHK
jgi:hypothetical protein